MSFTDVRHASDDSNLLARIQDLPINAAHRAAAGAEFQHVERRLSDPFRTLATILEFAAACREALRRRRQVARAVAIDARSQVTSRDSA